MPQRDLHGFVAPLCEKLAAEMVYELVDAELVKEGPGRYLRIYLDKAGGITLDDCERFHRAVQPRVEQVDYDFLEVCSPGLDRPLKTDRDFARALNTPVEVKLYKPMDGRKTYQGTLAGFDRETLRLLTDEGEVCVGRKAAAQIKPVIIFEDEDGGESEL